MCDTFGYFACVAGRGRGERACSAKCASHDLSVSSEHGIIFECFGYYEGGMYAALSIGKDVTSHLFCYRIKMHVCPGEVIADEFKTLFDGDGPHCGRVGLV